MWTTGKNTWLGSSSLTRYIFQQLLFANLTSLQRYVQNHQQTSSGNHNKEDVPHQHSLFVYDYLSLTLRLWIIQYEVGWFYAHAPMFMISKTQSIHFKHCDVYVVARKSPERCREHASHIHAYIHTYTLKNIMLMSFTSVPVQYSLFVYKTKRE